MNAPNRSGALLRGSPGKARGDLATAGAPRRWIVWIFVTACAVLLLGPFAHLIRQAFSQPGAFDSAGEVLCGAPYRALALFSAGVAAGAAAIATLLGVVVAVAIHRAAGWRRVVFATLFPVPLLIPPIILAQAWVHVAGKRGLLAALWKLLSGAPELPFSIYGAGGTAWVLALAYFPLVTMSTLVGLRALGGVAASGRLYAGPLRRAAAIDVPLLLPYVSAGAAFVAWLALGDLDVALVFLTKPFPLEIYTAFSLHPDLGRAVLACVPLLVIGGLVLLARQLLLRRGGGVTLDTRWRAETDRTPVNLPRWAVESAAAAVLALGVLVPVVSLIHQTAAWRYLGQALSTAHAEILCSFRAAAVAALFLLLLAAPYAWIMTRARGASFTVLALLALLPLMIPGTCHGIAWISLLQESAWGRALLGSPYVLSLAAAARFFPFGVFLFAAAFQGFDPRLLDAAAVAGVSRGRALVHVALPLICPGILAAFAIAFALSLGELSAAIMLNPPGCTTLPVRLSSLLHFGQDELLAALCLVQIGNAVTPYLAASLLLEKTLEARLG